MPKKTTADTTSNQTQINRFGVRCWTGADVKKLREDFGLSHDELASLLGLNHRSQSSRYEAKKEIPPLASLAFELVKRLLTAEREEGSGNASRSTFAAHGDEVKPNVHYTADSIRLELNNSDKKKAKLIVRLDFSEGLKLTVEELVKDSPKTLKEITLL